MDWTNHDKLAQGDHMTPYNLRRIIGYSVLTVLLTVLLSGCALWPSAFDSEEHARLVNIHVASIDDSVCNNRDTAAPVAQQMFVDARWAWHYGQSLTDNEKMTRMSFELMMITKEIADRYSSSATVSVFYCKNKFENIRRATDTAIKVSARRPRS
jgi:hypothetical protein